MLDLPGTGRRSLLRRATPGRSWLSAGRGADHAIRELVAIITAATPVREGHPAKRVFQALRIEVNEELLGAAGGAMPAALDGPAVGGRIVALAYQSLEDRIVKRALQAAARPRPPAASRMELPELRPVLRQLHRESGGSGGAGRAWSARLTMRSSSDW